MRRMYCLHKRHGERAGKRDIDFAGIIKIFCDYIQLRIRQFALKLCGNTQDFRFSLRGNLFLHLFIKSLDAD